MNTSENRTSTVFQNGNWLRRSHRWLGVAIAIFVVFLSCTGVALNHSSDWKLDDRYIASRWLLDAYGIRAPSVSASFSDGRHRVTLLGQRLYLDDREVAESVESLTGMVTLGSMVLVTSRDRAFLITADGELIERIDLSMQLGEAVERIGRAKDQAIISSAGATYVANADITSFERRGDNATTDIAWSESSAPPDSLLKSLEAQYRGQGLSIGRFIADLHSGRVVTIVGPYLMDMVAVLLVILSITGIVLSMRPRNMRRRS
jgi:hypothetical protein